MKIYEPRTSGKVNVPDEKKKKREILPVFDKRQDCAESHNWPALTNHDKVQSSVSMVSTNDLLHLARKKWSMRRCGFPAVQTTITRGSQLRSEGFFRSCFYLEVKTHLKYFDVRLILYFLCSGTFLSQRQQSKEVQAARDDIQKSEETRRR